MDWTGLDSWAGLDWTVGLDWNDFNIYFKCFAPQSFILGNFTYKYLPVISYGWPFVSKWVRDIWALNECICIFFTKHFKRIYYNICVFWTRVYAYF